jgi:4-hydroxy-2-oxoheptanedioate aldolase
MRQNRLKAKLLSGQPAFGVSVMIPSPHIVEMVSRLGFEWVLLDCEHGAISRETLELLVMAADAAGATVIARPASAAPEAILQVLESGASGVQVPHVSTADEARHVVDAVKYHPLGSRSLALGTRPAGYGFAGSTAGYAEAANRETLVCVQLEDPAALRHLGGMLAVPEIDVYFIGPSDLAQSMGFPGRPDAPEVREAMSAAFAEIAAAGKVPGSVGRREDLRELCVQGVRYLYTHVPALLASGAREYLAAAAAARSGRRLPS